MSLTRFHPRAEWIWRQRGVHSVPFGTPGFAAEDEMNRFVYFRRTFTLDEVALAAQVYASADGRYQLYCNGQLVGRGPARSSRIQQQVDPYDLTPYLRPGSNVIAALAHSYGRPTAWYEPPQWEHKLAFGSGGFFLQGDIETSGGVINVDTDENWLHLVSEAWVQDAPAGSLGFLEIYDARNAPVGWQGIDFDDSVWQTAECLRVPGRHYVSDIVPYPFLTERDIPPMFEEERWPKKVLLVGEVENAPEVGHIANRLAAETLADLDECQVSPIEKAISTEGAAEIITTESHSVCMVIDFGRTVAGRVCFDVDAPDGAIIDFTYSELLQEDGRVEMHEGIPGFDERPAHRVVLQEGRQSWEMFEWAGFRYMQVTIRRCPSPLRLHAIQINFTSYPVQHRGVFRCSDDLLNRIWQIGSYSEQLCMQDGYVDCPSREQRQWMGDTYIQTLINYVAFGDDKLAARLLRQVALTQQPDGILMMCAPGDFSIGKFINIPDFSLYWLLTLENYVLYTGDIEIVAEFYLTIAKLIRWFEQYLNEDSLLTDVPHWIFIDWAELDKKGQVTAFNVQFVAALNAAAGFARTVGQKADADRFESLAARVATAINRLLWDNKRGVYVDARHQGIQSRRVSQQTNSMAIVFGVAPPERWASILDTITDPDRVVLTRLGEHDLTEVEFDIEHNVVMAQIFTMHYVHRALCLVGRQADMVGNIRKRWDELIRAGDTTWRETWQLTEISSRSHAWGGSPTYDLSTEILGVLPTSSGFSTFRVAPQPVDLTWAEGVVPTPQGDIEVAWRQEDATFKLQLSVPANTRAEVISPYDGSSLMCEAGTHDLDFQNDRL